MSENTITAEECENVTLPGAQDLMFDWLHDQIAVRKRAAATIRSLQQPKVCEWNPKPDDRGAYSTACGVHVRDYKSITNFPKFCFNCGGKLTVRDGKPQEAVENDTMSYYQKVPLKPRCFDCGIPVSQGTLCSVCWAKRTRVEPEPEGPLSMDTWPLGAWVKMGSYAPMIAQPSPSGIEPIGHHCWYTYENIMRDVKLSIDGGATWWPCSLAGLRAARKAKGEAR